MIDLTDRLRLRSTDAHQRSFFENLPHIQGESRRRSRQAARLLYPSTFFATLIASFSAADLLIASSYSRAGSES